MPPQPAGDINPMNKYHLCVSDQSIYVLHILPKNTPSIEVGGASRDILFVCHQVLLCLCTRNEGLFSADIFQWVRSTCGGNSKKKHWMSTIIDTKQQTQSHPNKDYMYHGSQRLLVLISIRSTCRKYEKYASTCTPRISAVGATSKTKMTRKE